MTANMETKITGGLNNPAGPYSPWSPGIKPHKRPDFFAIEVLGCISEDWSNWFNGLEVKCFEEKGVSLLHGSVKDQAELFSILIKIQNLGLTLIRLNSNSMS
jgi:hypothetical protein